MFIDILYIFIEEIILSPEISRRCLTNIFQRHVGAVFNEPPPEIYGHDLVKLTEPTDEVRSLSQCTGATQSVEGGLDLAKNKVLSGASKHHELQWPDASA